MSNKAAQNQASGRGPGDRARLAAALKDARASAGISGTEAATRTGISQSKISKLERGLLLPSPEDVTALARAYRMPRAERTALNALASDLKEAASAKIVLARGMAEMQRRIGQLEAASTHIFGFQPFMVPGLLQTDAYMRQVFGNPPPQEEDDATQVDDAATARHQRQGVLDDETKQVELIVTEGALRWHVGSPDLMAEQLDHITDQVQRPNLHLGFIPWSTPVTIFPLHGFHLYDSEAAIVGTLTATASLTSGGDIATYRDMATALREVAVFGDEAAQHFSRIGSEYRALT